VAYDADIRGEDLGDPIIVSSAEECQRYCQITTKCTDAIVSHNLCYLKSGNNAEIFMQYVLRIPKYCSGNY
jgi:hypothetical protein